MNNRTLFLIFGLLLVIFLLTRLLKNRSPRSFQPEIVQVDTTAVDRLVLNKRSGEPQEIILKKEAAGWTVSKQDLSVPASGTAVESLMKQIARIKADRIVSKSDAQWSDYEVADDGGTRVQVFSGNTLLADFIVGRFNFNQRTRSGISYVRLQGEKEVYAIDGFLAMAFSQGFNGFREKLLLRFDKNELAGFTLMNQSQRLAVSRPLGNWAAEQEISLDTNKVNTYLSAINNSYGVEFYDGMPPSETAALASLELQQKNGGSISLSCFPHTGEKPFLVYSDQNPHAYFLSDSSGLFQKIFKPLDYFREN